MKRFLFATGLIFWAFAANAQIPNFSGMGVPNSPGAGGGSGTVGNCGTAGGVAYYSVTGIVITCSSGITASNTTLILGSGVTLTNPDASTVTSAGISNLTALGIGQSASSTIPLVVTGTPQTGSSANGIASFAQTWNTSGVVDAGLELNITNTASGANSKVFDFQVGGTPKFAMDTSGVLYAYGAYTDVTDWNGLKITPNTSSGALTIEAAKAGTGTYAGGITLVVGGLSSFAVNSFSPRTAELSTGGQFAWSVDGNPGNATLQTVISSPSTANLQFGAANVNGAPVAQTLSFQGALAGSATNTASANTTIIGSLGTGTGTNGDIILQTGVKTSTGTAQAAATTALTIKGETQAIIVSGNLTASGGIVAGAPTGGNEGTGTVNSAGAFYANGTKGVTCSGALTVVSSITITNGIITAATGTGGTCS